jgi:putative ABC transport system permease protein
MKLPYSLTIVWHERGRYFPASLAVAFSGILIALQGGLLMGMLAISSRPIDHASADIWVCPRGISSLGYGRPIPLAWENRLLIQPEVASAEEYVFGFAEFHNPGGGSELCYIIGTRLGPGALGVPREITPRLRGDLTETASVVVAASEASLLGLPPTPGSRGEVGGHRVKVIGLVDDFRGVGLMPGLYGSLPTGRRLSSLSKGQTTYLLARCHSPEQADRLAARLRARYPDMDSLTRAEFSRRTWVFWLTKTKAGAVIDFSSLLGLLIGALITNQTLRAATVVAQREYAVLRAMGIPRRRLAGLVMAQSFHVAAAGLFIALPMTLAMAWTGNRLGVAIALPAWVLCGAAAITLGVALVSALGALRSLRRADPVTMLR